MCVYLSAPSDLDTERANDSMADTTVMDKLVSLSKRRGFVFQSSEIYGGLGSVWDYGPLGVELKKNVKDRWWHAMVHARDDIEGLDAAILMHPRVWEASGHVAGFTDPLVDCRHCKNRFRADDPAHQGNARPARRAVPGVRQPGDADRAAALQPDVQDVHGAGRGAGGRRVPAAGDGAGHLRQLPERAPEQPAEDPVRHRPDRQGVPQRDHARELHLPHARVRADGDAVLREAGHRRGVVRVLAGVADGLASVARPRPRAAAFTSTGRTSWRTTPSAAFDIQYEFPFGWQEIEGIHNRGDFDLGRHQEYSGKKLEYFDQAANERYLPYIVETSAGADRVTLTLLVDAYREEEVEGETRVVLGLHPALAPIKAGVFPLVKKDGMPEVATELYHDLKRRFPVSTTTAAPSAGATGGRTRRARRSASRSTATRWRIGR